MNFRDFNAELREVRGNVSAGSVELYMLMQQRQAQHDEHMAKLDRQHKELISSLTTVKSALVQVLVELEKVANPIRSSSEFDI